MASSATGHPLPLPLPESEWVNKSQLNYTELNKKLADPIACMDVPFGVFGYYVYLAQHIMSLFAIVQTIRTIQKIEKNKESNGVNNGANGGTTFNFLRSWLTFIFSMLFLIQSCQTARECSSRFGLVGASNVMAIIWSCLTQIGSLFSLLGSVPCLSADTILGLNYFAIFAYGSATTVNFIPGFVLSMAVFQAGGVIPARSTHFFRWLDSVSLDATMVAEIPAMLITVILTIWGIYYYNATANDKTGRRVLKYGIICFFYIFIFFWTGASFVSLAKIFGSPWGKWWIDEKKGKLDAVWATVFPALQSFLTLVGW
ncbi:hypothetical protein BGZ63DRAFT_388057 [Mariannaea sp. PMI_226]|nr:hypothetical protein BGZ63DRAFT_388057 [Mariannaea sp. PMI_226]